MKYSINEGAYILAKFPTGSTVTISLYKLSDGSVVTLTSSSMTEIATTGVFKWHTSNITTQPTTYTEYLFIATDAISSQYGKFILEKDIQTRVWNSLLSDNTAQGTFGGELATKVDIKASAVSNYKSLSSSTIIAGSTISGSSVDVNARDGVYWTLGEDASTGLNIEFVFNLANNELAGLVSLFGRYAGLPSTSHYIQLWAYNYRVSTWEQLSTIFLPGGNTVDTLYEHEYQEDQIDNQEDFYLTKNWDDAQQDKINPILTANDEIKRLINNTPILDPNAYTLDENGNKIYQLNVNTPTGFPNMLDWTTNGNDLFNIMSGTTDAQSMLDRLYEYCRSHNIVIVDIKEEPDDTLL